MLGNFGCRLNRTPQKESLFLLKTIFKYPLSPRKNLKRRSPSENTRLRRISLNPCQASRFNLFLYSMFLEKKASLAPIGASARSLLPEIHSGWSESILREYPTTSVRIRAATAERKSFSIKLQ